MTGLVDQLEGWLGKVSFAVFKRSPFALLHVGRRFAQGTLHCYLSRTYSRISSW